MKTDSPFRLRPLRYLARGAIAGFKRAVHPRGVERRVFAREVSATLGRDHVDELQRRRVSPSAARPLVLAPALRLAALERSARAGNYLLHAREGRGDALVRAHLQPFERSLVSEVELKHGALGVLAEGRGPNLRGQVCHAEAVRARALPEPPALL